MNAIQIYTLFMAINVVPLWFYAKHLLQEDIEFLDELVNDFGQTENQATAWVWLVLVIFWPMAVLMALSDLTKYLFNK